MTVLFPPVLDSQARAFPAMPDASTVFHIFFNLPAMIDPKEIGHLQVALKYANTGLPAVGWRSPDRTTLYYPVVAPFFNLNKITGLCEVKIPYSDFDGGNAKQDTTYLVQVRFGSESLWDGGMDKHDGFAQWRQIQTTSVPSGFGEWSNQQKAYCHAPASVSIGYNFNDFVPEVVWAYSPVGDDPIAQVKMDYTYEGFHGKEYKTDVFDGQLNEDNVTTFSCKLKVAPVTTINVQIEAVTKNNTYYTSEVVINSLVMNPKLLPLIANPLQLEDAEIASAEREDGILAKRCSHPERSLNVGTDYSVFRINTLTLDCVKLISNRRYDEGEVVDFKDYSVEMGEDYQYVFVQYETDKDIGSVPKATHLLTPLYPFGPTNPCYGRLMKMESTFLTSRHHQLRLSGNVTLNSLKKNVSDQFQVTIGSKYPFYSRAAKTGYRSFSLSGLVTINFDPTSSFLELDNVGPIEYFDSISKDVYAALKSTSPGVADGKFFTPLPQGAKVPSEYRLDFGETEPVFEKLPAARQEEIKNQKLLVNRCLTSIVLNGLWWKDEGSRRLLIQDRDILESTEISLSRRRVQEPYNPKNEKLVELGKEEQHSLLVGKNGQPTFNGEGATRYNDYPDRENSQTPGPKSVYGDYLYRQSGLNYSTEPTDEMVFVERKFREKVMDWLSDGKPKLFRSETEGNMIVMTSGVSFAPLEKNRLVYTVSMTITEIAEMNSENLINYDLIPLEIRSYYPKVNLYDYVWGNKDYEVVTTLAYLYDSSMDIPNMLVNNPNYYVTIPTIQQVRNGSGKYTFSAENLPTGFSIDKDGVLSGYPTQGKNELTTATLKVHDEITKEDAAVVINVGYMYSPLEYVFKKEPYQPTLIGTKHSDTQAVIGEEIKKTPNLTPPGPEATKDYYMKGGVEPYQFFAKNMLPGMKVDINTGEISGFYVAPSDPPKEGETKMFITVVDKANQTYDIPVMYNGAVTGLDFLYHPDYRFGYTEVSKPLPLVDITPGVKGGKPPYVYTIDLNPNKQPWGATVSGTSPNIKYVFDTGFTFCNGVFNALEGDKAPVAIKASPAGKITVTIADAVGQTIEVEIPFKDVLETLLLVRPTDSKEAAEKFDVNPDGTIRIGENGITRNLALYAKGGLPISEDLPYKWHSAGLEPNFKLDQHGQVIGGGVVPRAKTKAEVWIEDNRGVCSPRVNLFLGEVTSGATTQIDYFRVTGLYEGEQIASRVEKHMKDGTTVTGNDANVFNVHNVQDFAFLRGDGTVSSYDDVNKTGADPDYNSVVTAELQQGHPGDVALTQVTPGEKWSLGGSSTKEKNGYTTFLAVKEHPAAAPGEEVPKNSTKELQIPVLVEPTYGRLTWDIVPSQQIRAELDTPFTVVLKGLHGGRPPFAVSIVSIGLAGSGIEGLFKEGNKSYLRVEQGNPDNISELLLTGLVAKDEFKKLVEVDQKASYSTSYSVKIKVQDSKDPAQEYQGEIVQNQHEVSFAVSPEPLRMKVEKRFFGEFYLKDLSRMKKVPIVSASGGLPPYRFYYGADRTAAPQNEVIPGGFILDPTGELHGVATEVSAGIDVGVKLWVRDALGTISVCTESWCPPVVVEPPAFDPQKYPNSSKIFEGDILIPKLVQGQYYRRDNLFVNLDYPNLDIKGHGLPTGLELREIQGKLALLGVPTKTETTTMGSVTVSFSGPPGSEIQTQPGVWQDADTGKIVAVKTLTLNFTGSYRELKIASGQATINIPKGVQADSLEVINIGDRLIDGQGPFSWFMYNNSGPHTFKKEEPQFWDDFGNCGLNMTILDDIGRNVHLGGTYGPVLAPKTFYLYCQDNGEKTVMFTINYNGGHEKLKGKTGGVVAMPKMVHDTHYNVMVNLSDLIENPGTGYTYKLVDRDGVVSQLYSDIPNYTSFDCVGGQFNLSGTAYKAARNPQVGAMVLEQYLGGTLIQTMLVTVSSKGVVGPLGFDRLQAVKNGKKIDFKLPINEKQEINDLDLSDGPVGGNGVYSFFFDETLYGNTDWAVECDPSGKIPRAIAKKVMIDRASFIITLRDSAGETVEVQVTGKK